MKVKVYGRVFKMTRRPAGYEGRGHKENCVAQRIADNKAFFVIAHNTIVTTLTKEKVPREAWGVAIERNDMRSWYDIYVASYCCVLVQIVIVLT